MKTYLLILPIALLVATSQILIKVRSTSIDQQPASSISGRLLEFAADPVVLSAYARALIASFAWLFVIARLPITIAFPVYIGVTFLMVVVGGWLFLAETISLEKAASMLLILGGIIIGLNSDA